MFIQQASFLLFVRLEVYPKHALRHLCPCLKLQWWYLCLDRGLLCVLDILQ